MHVPHAIVVPQDLNVVEHKQNCRKIQHALIRKFSLVESPPVVLTFFSISFRNKKNVYKNTSVIPSTRFSSSKISVLAKPYPFDGKPRWP